MIYFSFFWQAGRFPHLTYANLKSIIGKRFDDPLVEEYRRRHVNKMVVDKERNMPVFIHNETVQLSIEELIAYQFQNAKQQASATAGESVKDVVITVSSITVHLCFVFFFFLFTCIFTDRLHPLQINMNVRLFLMQLNSQG